MAAGARRKEVFGAAGVSRKEREVGDRLPGNRRLRAFDARLTRLGECLRWTAFLGA